MSRVSNFLSSIFALVADVAHKLSGAIAGSFGSLGRPTRLATTAGTSVGHWDPSLSSPGLRGNASGGRTAHEQSITTAHGVVLNVRYETGLVDLGRGRVTTVLGADVVCEKAGDWHVSKGTFSPDPMRHPDDPDGQLSLDFNVPLTHETNAQVPGGAHETLDPIHSTLSEVVTVRLHADGNVTLVRDQTQTVGVAP